MTNAARQIAICCECKPRQNDLESYKFYVGYRIYTRIVFSHKPRCWHYITLGELKGYDGDYDYDLPANVNFNTHTYVIVWCVDFDINFGHAVLQ